MLNGRARRALSLTGALGIAAGGLMLSAAPSLAACGGPNPCGGGDGEGSVDQSGSTITVTVTGSMVRGGSDGKSTTTEVTVPSLCGYENTSYTGKSYYEWVRANKPGWEMHHGEPLETIPGYEKYKDDTKGHWYGGSCTITSTGAQEDKDFATVAQWFKDHPDVYVPDGDPKPTGPVPASVLLDAAKKAITLPKADFAWNPTTATLVNLPTWFWLLDGTRSGSVTASVPTKSVAVDVNLTEVSFASPDAGTVRCAGTGVEWHPGATSDCTLAFPRATPGETVTGTAIWNLTWSLDGAVQGSLPAMSQSSTGTFPVHEAHALVNSVN